MTSPLQRALAAFQPRRTFPYDRVLNWFPGHMAKGLRVIQSKLSSTDLVIEVRDARIPVTSINPRFERLVGRKNRIVVYNKVDLADPTLTDLFRTALQKRQKVNVSYHLASTYDASNMRKLLELAGSKGAELHSLTALVVGMPNVGKSSLINALRNVGTRRGKAAKTGAQAGVTRSVASVVKVYEEPPIYLIDTPGVMPPHIPSPEAGIKIALTGGMRDHLADEQVIADYLLFQLNLHSRFEYASWAKTPDLMPTNDIHILLDSIARRIGAIHTGGEPDHTAAARFWIKQYREGKLGRMTLDEVRLADTPVVETESRRQEKKRSKLEKRKQARKDGTVSVP